MATKEYKTIFQFKRANSNEWPSNYVLQVGEPGFEIDTGKLKIGDGTTTWENLDYLNGIAFENTDGALVFANEMLGLNGFQGADPGQVPVKAQNGALTWINPLTVEDVMDDDSVNNWVEGKITAVTNRVYRGEAHFVSEDNSVVTLYDNNMEPIKADINDVYSYETQKFVWSGAEWVEITGAEIYATKRSVTELSTQVTNLAQIATDSDPGLVKSASSTNTIGVAVDGTMSVNSIGVDKLINNGYLLILNNGDSTE